MWIPCTDQSSKISSCFCCLQAASCLKASYEAALATLKQIAGMTASPGPSSPRRSCNGQAGGMPLAATPHRLAHICSGSVLSGQATPQGSHIPHAGNSIASAPCSPRRSFSGRAACSASVFAPTHLPADGPAGRVLPGSSLQHVLSSEQMSRRSSEVSSLSASPTGDELTLVPAHPVHASLSWLGRGGLW